MTTIGRLKVLKNHDGSVEIVDNYGYVTVLPEERDPLAKLLLEDPFLMKCQRCGKLNPLPLCDRCTVFVIEKNMIQFNWEIILNGEVKGRGRTSHPRALTLYAKKAEELGAEWSYEYDAFVINKVVDGTLKVTPLILHFLTP